MTKLDAIQQKIDAARAALEKLQQQYQPVDQEAREAECAHLDALDAEAHYTQLRMDAETKAVNAKVKRNVVKDQIDKANAEVTRWQAAWERALEE